MTPTSRTAAPMTMTTALNADNVIDDDDGMVDESQTGLADDDDDIESDLVEGDK